MRYLALVDLFYPTDRAVLRALASGENPPLRARGMKHVAAGSVVEDIPTVSIKGLLAKRKIEAVND